MKREILLMQDLDSILADLPTESQLQVTLRYGGPDELRQKMQAVREKVIALKAKLGAK